MLNIGCHLSSSKGFLAMGRTAIEIGASAVQFFTRNPRGGKAKDIDPADVAAFRALAAEHGLGPFLAHAPYTLNPCSADAKVRNFALETMRDDLVRMEHLPGNMYNFHPGSHVGQGVDEGIRLIAAQLGVVLTMQTTTLVLLENHVRQRQRGGELFRGIAGNHGSCADAGKDRGLSGHMPCS